MSKVITIVILGLMTVGLVLIAPFVTIHPEAIRVSLDGSANQETVSLTTVATKVVVGSAQSQKPAATLSATNAPTAVSTKVATKAVAVVNPSPTSVPASPTAVPTKVVTTTSLIRSNGISTPTPDKIPDWLSQWFGVMIFLGAILLGPVIWIFNRFFRKHDVRIVGPVGPLGVDVKWGVMSMAKAMFEKIPREFVKAFRFTFGGWLSPTQTTGYDIGWRAAKRIGLLILIVIVIICWKFGVTVNIPTPTPIP